jgi:hypothetical protein
MYDSYSNNGAVAHEKAPVLIVRALRDRVKRVDRPLSAAPETS